MPVPAGRPRRRLLSELVLVEPRKPLDDEAGARAKAAEQFLVYGFLPSYRAMLDREGVEGPADVALVGDAATVRAGIEKVFEAGATEFVAVPYDNRDATLEMLAGLL